MKHGCFLSHIKTARFVVPLIFFGKLEVFDGLQIHPKGTQIKQAMLVKKARKAHKYGASVRQVRRVRHVKRKRTKVCKACNFAN